MKLRVLRFRGDENGDVGVGIFPQRKKILICRLCFGGVALQCIGAGEAEMGECSDRGIRDDTAVVQYFLKLLHCLLAPVQEKKGQATKPHGVEITSPTNLRPWEGQFVRSCNLK